MNILTAPTIGDQTNPLVGGLSGAAAMVARSLANLRDRREQRAQRAAETADRNTERAGEQRYRATRDAVGDQRYQEGVIRQDNQTAESNRRQDAIAAKARQYQSIRDSRDEQRHGEQTGRQDQALADAREKQRMADIEAGRVDPSTPAPGEMKRAEFGQNQRKAAMDAVATQRREQMFVKINDQALEHAKQFTPEDQPRAYGDFWTQAKRHMPAGARADIDAVGNGLAKQVPGVAGLLQGNLYQPGQQDQQPAPVQQPADRPLRLKGTTDAQREPKLHNVGNDTKPIWRTYDPARRGFVPANMIEDPVAPGAETPDQREVRLTKETGYPDGESNWWPPSDWFRSPPAAAPAAAPAPGEFSLMAPVPPMDPGAVAETSRSMRRGAPPARIAAADAGPGGGEGAGASPAEPEFIMKHVASLREMQEGPGRQEALRRLRDGNPPLYAAVVNSLIGR